MRVLVVSTLLFSSVLVAAAEPPPIRCDDAVLTTHAAQNRTYLEGTYCVAMSASGALEGRARNAATLADRELAASDAKQHRADAEKCREIAARIFRRLSTEYGIEEPAEINCVRSKSLIPSYDAQRVNELKEADPKALREAMPAGAGDR